MFLYFISNVIFSIEIVYNDQEIVSKIEKELKKYEIQKFKLKKEYSELEKIKEEILSNNKDTLEWLEIVEDGTKEQLLNKQDGLFKKMWDMQKDGMVGEGVE